MKIGYARVSKGDGTQNLDMQMDALIQVGVDRERIYVDHASGAKTDREGLDACMKALQPGNQLCVWKLDRLGRSMKHLIDILEKINHIGAHLYVASGVCSRIDTTRPEGKILFTFSAMFAEIERDYIRERTKAGLEAARKRGKPGGRPFKVHKAMLLGLSEMMKNNKWSGSASEVARKFGISKKTLYHYVDGMGNLRDAAFNILNLDR